MTKFQLILTGVFGAFIVIGVIFFSLSTGGGPPRANMTVWGVIPQTAWNEWLAQSEVGRDDRFSFQYVEIKEGEFDNEFVSALAEGRGPDLIVAPHEKVLSNAQRLLVVPYESFTQRDFRSAFVEAGEVFLLPTGTVAFPLSVNPLILYWNRDAFTAHGLVKPPSYWDEIYTLAPRFTRKDSASNLVLSAIALGEYSNVLHAKDILSTLIMQAGGTITETTPQGLQSTLNFQFEQILVPANAALLYYTEFSNPAKPHYSWNRSLLDSLSKFAADNLALYIGYASELSLIKEKNPNLNFDVARIPQARTSTRPISFGKVLALAIPRTAPNAGASFEAALALTGKQSSAAYEAVSGLPPARRDLLSVRPTDLYKDIFYDGAIFAKTWIDPAPQATAAIWQSMIESVTSGRARVEEAVNRAHGELDRAVRSLR